jgi:hypothetical protein
MVTGRRGMRMHHSVELSRIQTFLNLSTGAATRYSSSVTDLVVMRCQGRSEHHSGRGFRCLHYLASNSLRATVACNNRANLRRGLGKLLQNFLALKLDARSTKLPAVWICGTLLFGWRISHLGNSFSRNIITWQINRRYGASCAVVPP